jgi:hypothetical protein
VWVLPDLDLVVARAQSRAYLHATEKFEEKATLDLVRGACR